MLTVLLTILVVITLIALFAPSLIHFTLKKIFKKYKPLPNLAIKVIVLIFWVAITPMFLTSSSSSSNAKDYPVLENRWKDEDQNSTKCKSMAYTMMEKFVKNSIKSPSSAEFPGVFDGKLDHVTSIGDYRYQINSYVDAQNSFGAMIRTRFVGVVKRTSEDYWELEKLKFIE